MTHFVTSSDGTSIAFSKTGIGKPLILVDGAFCHRNFGANEKLPHRPLYPTFNTWNYMHYRHFCRECGLDGQQCYQCRRHPHPSTQGF